MASTLTPGYQWLPRKLRRYLDDPRQAPPVQRFYMLPVPPNTPNPLNLWGGVYELAPHGLTARALCQDRAWAEHICHQLNEHRVPSWVEQGANPDDRTDC